MRKKVVIVGGGFGGLTCAQALAGAPVDIVVVDRTNHHLFQPLLYQVAMAGLSPADIASPIRSILSRQQNASVLLGEATRVDLAGRRLILKEGELTYDWLVLATGAETSYFGHDDWERLAPGLKSIEDAIEIRQRVLLSFEVAERILDPEERERLLSFIVIGGGPTGVELAGALAELSRFVLARDFRSIRPESARILLLEGGPRILASFPEDLSARATEQLDELGVRVRTDAMVTRIAREGVYLGDEHLPASIVLWAAGVRANPLTRTLGVEVDRAGRVPVLADLTVKGHPEAFVIGDAALVLDAGGHPLPGVSPVAMQEARVAARSIARALDGKPHLPFRYFDKGSMATIGRSRAIAQTGRVHLSGFLAWLAWLTVHIWYLIGFRNRFVVMFTWFWSYVTYRRGARLITDGRRELEQDEGATVSSGSRAERTEAPRREAAPQAGREGRA